MKLAENATDRVQAIRERACKQLPFFDAILARFERKFGAERIGFEVFDYHDAFGISLSKGREEDGDFYRIAIRFDRHDEGACVAAAMEFVEKWLRGETQYKGVPSYYILEGNEINARGILAGESK
jgi:hypothetical protein